MSYDRYKNFRVDGKIEMVPFCQIEYNSSDIIIVYDRNTMRMDLLSYRYYGDPNYGWLIMLANPQYGSMEFDIEDGVEIRIPYPLTSARLRYENSVKNMTDRQNREY